MCTGGQTDTHTKQESPADTRGTRDSGACMKGPLRTNLNSKVAGNDIGHDDFNSSFTHAATLHDDQSCHDVCQVKREIADVNQARHSARRHSAAFCRCSTAV